MDGRDGQEEDREREQNSRSNLSGISLAMTEVCTWRAFGLGKRITIIKAATVMLVLWRKENLDQDQDKTKKTNSTKIT